MSFKDKVAVVTGAGKGIGRATALALAQAGAKVVLVGHRKESIALVQKEIENLQGTAMAVKADVSSWSQVQQMADAAQKTYGRVDLLVNNAGIEKIDKDGKRYSVLDLEDADWDYILGVNLKGQYHCIKAIAPLMIQQKFGRIVNLSSTTGFTGGFGTVAYCSSKAGIIVMTKSIATELGPHNITVNCVAPGLTLTPMHDYTPSAMIDMVKSHLPLRRVGEADDIARAILYFLSEDQFSTGQTLVVDGGGTMR